MNPIPNSKLTMRQQELVRRFRAALNRDLYLGDGIHTGRGYYLNPDDYLQTHMQIIGASTFGKSFLMEHALREYIAFGIPASIIDPHGDQAANYLRFLKSQPALAQSKRIVPFRPGASASTMGFNPFSWNLQPGVIAGLMLEAFMKAWGRESFNETPLLERVLHNMFHVFAVNRLRLADCHQFLLVGNRSFRDNLLEGVSDERVRADWAEIEQLPKSERVQRLESSRNRIQRFFVEPAIEKLFSTEGPSLDFTTVLQERRVLVANLDLIHSRPSQSLVGTILVNALYHAAKRQPKDQRTHSVWAIDEFPQFVTSDIANGLDELRKFGIRLILAHQRLAQLPPDLLSAVMTNAKIKAVFGGLSRADAEILARELFTGAVTGDKVKYINEQTKFRPELVEREVESFSESETDSEAETDGWSSRTSYGRSDNQGDSRSSRLTDQSSDETVTNLFSTGSTSSDDSGSSGSRASSRGNTRGRTWGTQIVTEHQEFREETSRQFWSQDEEWEKVIARMMNLNKREALIKAFNWPVIEIRTPDIEELPEQKTWIKSPLLANSIYNQKPPQKQSAKKKDTADAKPKTKPQSKHPADDLPEDFWEVA